MTILAQLSDLHQDAGGDERGAARALRNAVAAVLELRPAPDAVPIEARSTSSATIAATGRVPRRADDATTRRHR